MENLLQHLRRHSICFAAESALYYNHSSLLSGFVLEESFCEIFQNFLKYFSYEKLKLLFQPFFDLVLQHFSPNECPGLYWYSLFNSLGKTLKAECKEKWKRQFWVFISHIKKIWNVSQELFIQYKPYIEEQRMIDIGWLFSTYLFKYVKQYALHTIIGIAWSAKNIFPQFSSRRPHLILNIWCGLRCYKNNS